MLYTTVMLGIWTLAYGFVHWSVDLPRVDFKKALDIKNRIISMVHGTLAFWLCSITLLIKPNVLQYVLSHPDAATTTPQPTSSS